MFHYPVLPLRLGLPSALFLKILSTKLKINKTHYEHCRALTSNPAKLQARTFKCFSNEARDLSTKTESSHMNIGRLRAHGHHGKQRLAD